MVVSASADLSVTNFLLTLVLIALFSVGVTLQFALSTVASSTDAGIISRHGWVQAVLVLVGAQSKSLGSTAQQLVLILFSIVLVA